MDSSGVWQPVCVRTCDGFSRCCAVSWSMTSNKRSGAAPLMSTLHARYFFWDSHYSCRPRSNGKNTCGSFPVQKAELPTRPAGCARRGPSPDWRTDGLAVTHIFLLLSFTTHTCREIRAARGLSWPNRLCGFPFDLWRACGEADLDHIIQQKSHQQAAWASRWACNMAMCVCLTVSSIRVMSGAQQRPPTGFWTTFASLGTDFPTADWPELSLNPELLSSKAPADCTRWID